MYSLPPALVSLLFLAYGAYVLGSRGASRVALSFFLVCITTFVWQFTWAILFQVNDPALAVMLAKGGYLLILFLPTTIYQFAVELTRKDSERVRVTFSYAGAAVLALVLLSSELLVAGVYQTFFGFYPKAGLLHPLHIAHTAMVISRAAWLLLRQQKIALSTDRLRLRYCLASLLIYYVAAVDYLCNYGIIFYPPGAVFVAISLGVIAQAIARHNLLANPMMLAATVAHELRTPLATIRNQARILSKSLPELLAAYEFAQQNGGKPGTLRPALLDYLRDMGNGIESEVSRSNFIAEMVLTSSNPALVDSKGFTLHSVERCVDEALACYPFDRAMRDRIVFSDRKDFSFYGSDTLLVYVLYNLIKNALAALDGSARGKIEIGFYPGAYRNCLIVRDTGHGISEHVLPHVFDPFYTTKTRAGTGMGLAFCKRVIESFGGSISCSSREGAFTLMALEFPVAVERVQDGLSSDEARMLSRCA